MKIGFEQFLKKPTGYIFCCHQRDQMENTGKSLLLGPLAGYSLARAFSEKSHLQNNMMVTGKCVHRPLLLFDFPRKYREYPLPIIAYIYIRVPWAWAGWGEGGRMRGLHESLLWTQKTIGSGRAHVLAGWAKTCSPKSPEAGSNTLVREAVLASTWKRWLPLSDQRSRSGSGPSPL